MSWINPQLLPRPTIRNAKVTDPYTGQVIQRPGPATPVPLPGPAVGGSAVGGPAVGGPAVGGSSTGTTMGRAMPRPRLMGRTMSSPVVQAGGGGGGGGGGGYSEASYAPRRPRKIHSDRDGTTTAPMARARTGPLSPDFAPAFGGLAEHDAMNEDRPKLTSWGEDWPLPAYAEGTAVSVPIPLGQPFIAGDAKKGTPKKPNEELIIPTAEGVHVFPLEDLPELNEGTGKTGRHGDTETRSTERRPRVDGRTVPTKGAPKPLSGMREFYGNNPGTPTAAQVELQKVLKNPSAPVKIPRLPLKRVPKMAYGTVGTGRMELPETVYQTGAPGQEDVLILKPTPYDAGGLNFSQGDGSGPVPHVAAALAGMPAGSRVPVPVGAADPLGPTMPERTGVSALPASKSAFETVPEFVARREAMNPEGIRVGVTPRAPLVPMARAKGLPVPSSEGGPRVTPRAMRDVQRLVRDNPGIALQLWQDQQAGLAAAEKFKVQQQGAQAVRGETQRHNAAMEENQKLSREEASKRAHAELQRMRDNDAVARNFKVGEFGMDMAKFAREFEMPETSFQAAPGSDMGVVYSGTKPMSVAKVQSLPQPSMRQTAPGSGIYYNPDLGKADRFAMTAPEEQYSVTPAVADRIPFYGQALEGLPVPGLKRPASFKPVEKPQKAAAVKKVNRSALLDEIAKAQEIIADKNSSPELLTAAQSVLRLAQADLNGDGVVSPAESAAAGAGAGAAGAATGKPQPLTGFRAAVQ